MEEQLNSPQRPDYQPEQTGMSMNWEPPTSNLARWNESVPRRLEWIAVVLFLANFVLMLFAVEALFREGTWGILTAAVSTATAVILLLSVALSIFGVTRLAKVVLGIGLAGLMISSLSIGVKIINQISEYSHY